MLLALAAAQAAGPPAPAEARFKACTSLIRTAPERAIADAAAWRTQGGGLPARQCNALALAALGRWAEAAAAFEQAAQEADAFRDPSGADFRVQSGNAWLAAGDPAKARLAFDTALTAQTLSPELRGEVHLDRGRAFVALDDLASARRDFDKATELVPKDGFAWYMSAALARRQRDMRRAQAEIAKAVALAPDDAGVLLEAGNIAAMSGDEDAASGLYARAARAAPDSEAGRAAAAALAANAGGQAAPPPAETQAPR
jgi:tetratricopeptide (TPR) repeat protein